MSHLENHEIYRNDNRPNMVIVSPFMKSKNADIPGFMVNWQFHPVCGTIQRNTMFCLEAYGYEKGFVRCRDYIDDFAECSSYDKQRKRVELMRNERRRQFWAGERNPKYAAPPKLGSAMF